MNNNEVKAAAAQMLAAMLANGAYSQMDEDMLADRAVGASLALSEALANALKESEAMAS